LCDFSGRKLRRFLTQIVVYINEVEEQLFQFRVIYWNPLASGKSGLQAFPQVAAASRAWA
jgi:hypothetical protein